MRKLQHTLLDQDPGFLRIIAELWGFDPPKGSIREAALNLAEEMLHPDLLREIVTALPLNASDALDELVSLGGRMPWNAWDRKYGPLRQMGPGKRDRDQPWREATAPAEVLWYRGLLGRTFLDTPKGPEEFAYLPLEIFQLIEHPPQEAAKSVLDVIEPPVLSDEPAATIIDEITTILAALRRQTEPLTGSLESVIPLLKAQLIYPQALELCLALISEIGLVRKGTYEADLNAVPEFLLADRMMSLQQLYTTWKYSQQWNDLAALPSLRTGGEWQNDPIRARETILRWIGRLESGSWYAISDLIRAVYKEDPAFQRPASQFDTWYLQDENGIPLDGIEHWHNVEGTLLRSLLIGPLNWFGTIQLGYEDSDRLITSFTPTRLFDLLESTKSHLPTVDEEGKAMIRSDGQVTIPRHAPRSLRYQLARLLEWEPFKDNIYRYRLSLSTIHRAAEQGLDVKQVRAILANASDDQLPPTISQILHDFESHSYEAEIDQALLLRVSEASHLDTLATHRSTKRYIDERLNDQTAIVRSGNWEQLIRAATALAILIDGPGSGSRSTS